MDSTYLITGGAGFIGGNFVRWLLANSHARIVNLDLLTYAGSVSALEELRSNPRHIFVQGNIGDRQLVSRLLEQYQCTTVVNFAAETHVDRSIGDPGSFIQTNIVGAFQLLDAVLSYWESLPEGQRERFRFLQISTDEVYGSLGSEGYFRESSQYSPNSPYSASKAAADHLVRAYHHTYKLPVLTTNCSNNYGPYQFPEKLIPLTILRVLRGETIPVYGTGANIRDWLFVADHCRAIQAVLERGRVGEVYAIGGDCERTNLNVVRTICRIVDELRPDLPYGPSHELIRFVKDRPGHDLRYAIDASKLHCELSWRPTVSFEEGIAETVRWYRDHENSLTNDVPKVVVEKGGDQSKWLRAAVS